MKLSMDDILLMNALSQVTGVNAKDCIVDGELVSFLIPEKDMGKAIGKNAANVKELQERLKKRVELIPYYEKAEETFARALEIDYATARNNGGRIVVMLDAQNKAKAYKNNSRIKRLREIIRRNFNLELIIS